jgi:hypothetical protein
MQTIVTTLLTVKRRSQARVRRAAQDSDRARGLLYLAAVRDDWRGSRSYTSAPPGSVRVACGAGAVRCAPVFARVCSGS